MEERQRRRLLAQVGFERATVRTGPLLRRRVEVGGDMLPGPVVQGADPGSIPRVLHEREHAGQFLQDDDRVGRAVVFCE